MGLQRCDVSVLLLVLGDGLLGKLIGLLHTSLWVSTLGIDLLNLARSLGSDHLNSVSASFLGDA